LQRDGVAEPFQLCDESPGDPFRVGASGEVVAAEIVVGDVVFEDVVAGDQDRVRDRDDRLLVAAAAFDLLVLGAQVGVLGACGSVGGLDQRGAQVRVAFAGLAGAALAAGFVIAWQIAAQLAAWRSDAKRLMSGPSSAMITWLVRSDTPWIVVRSSALRTKGTSRSSISAVSVAIISSR
jgi:hypothetical protein